MRTRCIVLGILVLVLTAATAGLAQASPPDHARAGGPGDPGPGDPGPDRGPPSHADSPHAESVPRAADDDSSAREPMEPEADAVSTDPSTAATARDTTAPANGGSSPSQAQVPVAAGEAAASEGSTTNAPASETETTPGILAGLVPGIVLGALGVLALTVTRRPQRMDPPARPARRTVEPASGEPIDDRDTPDEAEPDTNAEQRSPEGGVAGVIEQGQRALEEDDVEAAADWFQTAVELAPRLQAARFCLGLCLDELGRLEEAEARLRAARSLEDDAMAAYAHASVLARLGRTRQAVEVLERLSARLPAMRERMREDGELAALGDHPRFLALIGEL